MENTTNKVESLGVPTADKARAVAETERCMASTNASQMTTGTGIGAVGGLVAGAVVVNAMEKSGHLRYAAGVSPAIKNMASIVDKMGKGGMFLTMLGITVGGAIAGAKLAKSTIPSVEENADACASKIVARIKAGNAAVTSAASKAGVTLN